MKVKNYSFKPSKSPTVRLLLLSFLLSTAFNCLYGQSVTPYRLLADDILIPTGGTFDSENKDIYVIDMGNFNKTSDYPVTISRPKGAGANYPVSVDYKFFPGTTICFTISEIPNNPDPPLEMLEGTLTFAPGETSKTLYVKMIPWVAQDPEFQLMASGFVTSYLLFSHASRVRVECPVVQLNFNNPNPVTFPTLESSDDSINLIAIHNYDAWEIGNYMLVSAEYTMDWEPRYTIITPEQKLSIDLRWMDHNAFPSNVSDMEKAADKQLRVSPREVNSTADRATFIYKLQEEYIISNYTNENYGWNTPFPAIHMVNRQMERIKQLGLEELGVQNGEVNLNFEEEQIRTVSIENYYLPPRFGTITTDKTEYKGGESVRIDIPFHNWKLYKKVYKNAWLDNIYLTIDNGTTFIASNKTFNESTGNLSFSFNAPEVADGEEYTIYAEVMVKKEYEYDEPKLIYPQGAYTPVKIKSDVAPVVFTESIDISGQPDQDIIFLEQQKNFQLNYSVLPENSSFLNAVWSSSNPEIAEISYTGNVTAKKSGNVTFSLTSDEVAYRKENGLANNDDVLIQTVGITVKDSIPKLYGADEWHSMEDETVVKFFYNQKGGWEVKNNKATVVLRHTNGRQETVIVDIIPSDGIIPYTVPFESRFPKRPSETTSGNLKKPTCNVEMRLTFVDPADGQEYDVKANADVFIYYSQMQFKAEFVEEINTGEAISVPVEINYLPSGNYKIEYQLRPTLLPSGWGGILPGESYDSKTGNLPKWLTIEPAENGYLRALLNVEFIPFDINAANLYNIVLTVTDVNNRIKKETIEIANVTFVDSTVYAEMGSLIVNDTDTDNLELIQDFENKIKNGASLSEFRNAMGKIMDKTIRKFVFYGPKIWGEAVCTFDGGPIQKDNKGTLMVIHPMDGEPYTIKVEWPEVGVEKTFTYTCRPLPQLDGLYFFDIYHCHYHYKSKTSYGEPLELEYTTAGNVQKIVPVTNISIGAEIDGKVYTERFYVYEPDTISGPIFLRTNNRQRPPSVLTTYRSGLSYSLRDKAYYIINPYTDNRFNLTPELSDVTFRVLDEKGNFIPNARINYAFADKERKPLETPVSGILNTNEKGEIVLPLDDFSSISGRPCYIMMEVLAEGFYPQVTISPLEGGFLAGLSGHSFQMRDFCYEAVLKDIKSQSKCTGVEFSYISFHRDKRLDPVTKETEYTYFADENTIDITNEPANSIIPFRGQAKLTVTLPYEGSIDNLRLGGTGIDSTLFHTVDYGKIIKEDFGFENDYATLVFYINTDGTTKYYKRTDDGQWFPTYKPTKDWCAPQQSTRLYLKDDTGIVVELPGITNLDADASTISEDVEDFSIPMHGPENKKIGSVAANNGKSFDANDEINMSGAFSRFDITLPSTLPFTMNVRREDGKFYIRGIYSHNFLDDLAPGMATARELASLGSDFLNTFDDIKDAVNTNNEESKIWRPRQTRIFGFFGDDFVGIKGYCEGVIFYNPKSKKYEISFSEAGLGLEAGGVYSMFPSAGGAFIGLDVGLQLEARLAAYLKATNVALDQEDYEETIKVDIQLETSFKAGLRAWVAAGFDIWIAHAKAGVMGQVNAHHKNRFDFPTYKGGERRNGMGTNFYGNIVAFASAGFLCFTGSSQWELLRFDNNTYWTPNNSTNPYYGRRYLSPASNSQGNSSSGSINLRSAGYQPVDLRSMSRLNTLINNLGLDAEPRYLLGGKSLAFSNMKKPEDNNDDRLQIFTNGKQKDLIEAETPSFAFDVASTTDRAVAVYEQLSEPIVDSDLTANSMETAMKKQASKARITAAVYKNNAWTAETLSDNNSVNMAPSVALQKSNGKAAAIWSSGNLTGENNKQFITGELLFSRYNGTKWDAPISIAGLDKNQIFSDYQMLMENDTVLIVASRSMVGENSSPVSSIVFISIAPDNTVNTYVSSYKGGKAQMVRVGDVNLVSFLSKTPDLQQDVKMVTVDMLGLPTGKINSFAGLGGHSIQNYRLVTSEKANNLNDVALVWNEMDEFPTFEEMEENGFSITYGIYSSKLGMWNDTLFTSFPVKVFSAPEGYTISSYDAYLNNLTITVAATISNLNSGAVVVEETGKFNNQIESSEISFPTRELYAGSELPVSFTVTNKGYQPITSIEVEMQGKKQQIDINLLPRESTIIQSPYSVSGDFDGSISYDITAGFTSADNSLRASQLRAENGMQEVTSSKNGDASVVDMTLDLVSNASNASNATLLLKVVNNSPFKINQASMVEVGLYKDPEGEELYGGTSVQTIPASDLYDAEKGLNSNAMLVFNVPNVVKEEIAYMKVRTLNGKTEIMDKKTIDNLLPVYIYPPAKLLVAPEIITTTLSNAVEGKEYSENLFADSELFVTWTWEKVAGVELPAGLKLDASTGIISGTPLKEGEYVFNIIATNDAGSDKKEVVLVITKGTGIDTIDEKEIEVYPNPVDDLLYIKHNFDILEKTQIIGVEGKALLSHDNYTGKSIDVSSLNPGVYFVEFTINGQKVMRKFIKK